MKFENIAIVKREVTATLIPYGEPIELFPGTEVLVTQSLGGYFTLNVNGNLVRLEGREAGAIGQEVPKTPEGFRQVTGDEVTEEQVKAALSKCYDPEIPVNIVDLGLIYNFTLTKLDLGGYYVGVQMTLTAPGCGMGPFLVEDVEYSLYSVSNVVEVDVVLVFDPPWTSDLMSEAAKLELGLL